MIIKTIGTGILVIGMTVANWLGVVPSDYFVPVEIPVETKVVYEYLPAPTPEKILGSTFQTGEVKALFVTSLASRITSTDTSMTLVSATDKDGNILASSTYGFIIDEGTSVEEFVLADCTSTACTNMTRGLSVTTGTTTVSALRFAHSRGAEVKITDAPALIFATNVFKGKQNIENVITYNSIATTTINANRNNLASAGLIQDAVLNAGGIIGATETAYGVVEIATGIETASSTTNGTTGRLAIPASLATSTYNSATAPLKVVVTQNNGKIDSNFLGDLASTTIVVGTATTSTGATLTQMVPVGSITAYASTTAPTGWLLANGTSITVAMYPNLFAVIGYSYGGSGANFTLPDLSGRNIIMASTTANIGQKSGESNHIQTGAELAAHTHTVPYYYSSGGATMIAQSSTGGAQQNEISGSTGSSAPMNVLDPYIVLQYIIKY